ncbi:PVC-type heme-binding CxxCH protein [Algoriphagus persicinus]|uniref:PVC-type heme-binding CxxCH protein n=1 Tax=Algoriphagus persicinus TaxID=3108754 RepID=UPI002B3972E2|nr:PVC-type heme-binding CxxCH protein [Algoriphagus sp. E1-3-M2]MEB2787337.1 PVC-type heme-binding CxxCH protein [Algoriphagus sp. E1-3-M2]
MQVPEGYSVEMVAGADLVDYPMFGTLDETGRLFLFESTGDVYTESEDAIKDPQFRINLLEDLNGDGIYDKSTIYADKVGFPQGGVFHKGSLYATSAPDLIKFTDTDGDGKADQREVMLSGWKLNVNANSLIGPFLSPDGWLYMTSAIMGFDVTTQEGEQLKGETSRVWRVRLDGSGLEWVSAGGMNNPVELTFTAAGEPIGTMTYFTEPKAGQRDALIYWTEGGVYPKPNDNIGRDKLTRTGDLLPVISKYSRVSPAGIYRYRNTGLGEDFKDNLFSAQFNTHKIIRHKLIREGASFRTEDEPFLWKDDEDFHPTDVLEDADGSLLVVETGGWFIKGCPLSQVSKPELKGAIYRIRKNDAKKVSDPYGNGINWTLGQPEEMVEYLEDSRPFIRDKAGQALVDIGNLSVKPLIDILKTSSIIDSRTNAVFILYRIGTEDALAGVREGLYDKDQQVRIAAARAAGLAKDALALEKLRDLVQQNDVAVQRQAATSLGQIGDQSSVSTLLAASEKNNDRFTEHAIINSLIQINKSVEVIQALIHPSENVQETALIALDQMSTYQLKASQLIPFLEGSAPKLTKTALWLVSLHPDWSGEMSGFISKRFVGAPLSQEEENMYGDILASFCGNSSMQKFMVDQMKAGTSERKIFLLEAMSKCEVDEIPAIWVTEIGRQLATNDPAVQYKALELVLLREISSLSNPLQKLTVNEKIEPGLRLEALTALLISDPSITDQQFDFIFDQLQVDKEPPLRQQAANVLTKGKLSEKQLLKISVDFLPLADAFILPRLIPVFRGSTNGQIGEVLAKALTNSPSLDSYNEENLRVIFANFPAEVNSMVEKLFEKLRKLQALRLQRLQALEKQIPKGDLQRGRSLYFGKAICSTCHTLGPEGGDLGPDLTSIQQDRSAHDLLESIVYPSATFVREYETYRIKTKTNEYRGIITENTPNVIVLATSPQTTVRISRADIISTLVEDVSMMPQGLDQLLSDQELADLMAFILGQDQNPDKDRAILR